MEVTPEGGDVGQSPVHRGSPVCLCLIPDSPGIYAVHGPLRRFLIPGREILPMVGGDSRGFGYGFGNVWTLPGLSKLRFKK